MSLTGALAYLTGDLPGVGGILKERLDDFLVEEQPLYEPCGEGEHLYLFVEKAGQTTPELVRHAARAFQVGRGEVGYAGLKDKRGRTRQLLSIHLPGAAGDFTRAALDRLDAWQHAQVLWADWHTNKLRRGHLAGNRFVIYVRQVSPTAVVAAKKILDRLAATGAANYLGEQRFGYRGNGHRLGRHLLRGEHRAMLDALLAGPGDADSDRLRAGRAAYERGDYARALEHWPKSLRFDRQALDALRQGRDPRHAVRAIDRQQRQLLINAWQSAIFNEVLDQRVRAGELAMLKPGDLAWKHDSRAVFAVDETTAGTENAEGGRMATMAVSPSGPMWGVDMPRAKGGVGEAEAAALAASGLSEAQLNGAGDDAAEGSRRPLRIPLRDPELSGGADEHGPYVRLAFELPRGAYATMVLREIMKSERTEGTEGTSA